jgi:hypothetical protein
VLLFGMAVGLTTTNLGTLSRYRMPLVPFFAALLVLFMDADKRVPGTVKSLSARAVPRRSADEPRTS